MCAMELRAEPPGLLACIQLSIDRQMAVALAKRDLQGFHGALELCAAVAAAVLDDVQDLAAADGGRGFRRCPGLFGWRCRLGRGFVVVDARVALLIPENAHRSDERRLG